MVTKSPNDDEIRERYKRAAEIVKDLPEAVQPAAFQRALDEISGAITKQGGTAPSKSTARSTRGGSNARRRSLVSSKEGDPGTDRAATLERSLNRTKYPQITSSLGALERSLHLLRAARDDQEIDGLTPGEIAQVLTNKFRVRTTAAAVRMALGGAGSMVDRYPEGRGYLYRIMDAGEDHLKKPVSDQTAKSRPRKGTKRGLRKTPKVSPKKVDSTEKPSARKTKRGRLGPKELLENLIDSGFFDGPKTIGSIVQHVRTSRGQTYKPTDLSPALGRLLREQKLSRAKNKEGQYEYTRHQ